MSSTKRYMESLSEWDLHSNLNQSFVCVNCIGDQFLQQIIKKNLINNKCTYCEDKSDTLISARLADLMQPIYDGLKSEWKHPIDVLRWDSQEGGWQGADVYDSYDMGAYIACEAGIDKQDLIDDITEALSDHEWCKYPGDVDFKETLQFCWDNLTNLIKHKYRYTFPQIEEKLYYKADPHGRDISPKEFLLIFGNIIEDHNLIQRLPIGTIVHRARIFAHQPDIPISAKELGTPPFEKARSSRMSPAGISSFYGSLDEETARIEVLNSRKISNKENTIIGQFKGLIDLEVLNLCNIPHLGSIFDPEKRLLRQISKFLENFKHEISKPIPHDGQSEHIEYIPTQVLTEYLRHVFKYNDKKRSLKGILYPSSYTKEPNCTLFVDNSQCVDNNSENTDTGILQLVSHKKSNQL